MEWKNHAEEWWASIDKDHGTAPTGSGTDPKYFDNTDFTPTGNIEPEITAIIQWIENHISGKKATAAI